MNTLFAEFLGTAILILLGNGVVANVVLNQTKGQNSGWIVITFGWALAVFVPVLMVGSYSGAHLNPAVTLAFIIKGTVPLEEAGVYIGGQVFGAAVGSFLVWLNYRQHIEVTENPDAKLAIFATSPAIRNPFQNFFSEMIATFVFVLAVLLSTTAKVGEQAASLGSLDALPVALVVLCIGLCLGGTTGYAINPVRDLVPRMMHAILPISGKGSSDWGYAWVPVAGPLVGGALAAALHNVILKM